MAEQKGFLFDFKDFNKGFKNIVDRAIPGLAEKGLFLFGARMINYCITEEPRAPHKTGHLWRNQKIEVIRADARFIGIEFGFNVSYAAKLHEAPAALNWTLAGSGPKYVEAKLAKHKDEAMKEAAEYIKSHAK